jgi:uncharacterized membrane protein YfcA
MQGLIICCGTVVGFSMGLTGAGGSLLASPMLVYGIGFSARDAVGISLAAVGCTALIGAVPRMRSDRIDVRAGLIVAACGMLTAPLGTRLAGLLNEVVLLTAFAGLMLTIAVHMLRSASVASGRTRGSGSEEDAIHAAAMDSVAPSPTVPVTKLRKRYRIVLLMIVGLMTGFLSGLFGVGGGFILVPALLLVTRMRIDRAIGTSLLCIFLVSVSGVTSLALHHQRIPLRETTLFIIGGVLGLLPASRIAGRVSGPKLQRVFASSIILIAGFVVVRAWT